MTTPGHVVKRLGSAVADLHPEAPPPLLHCLPSSFTIHLLFIPAKYPLQSPRVLLLSLAVMKYFLSSTILGLAAVTQLTSAIVLPTQQEQVYALSGVPSDSFIVQDAGSEKRLVQLGPMEIKWVTEDEKLELRRVSYSRNLEPATKGPAVLVLRKEIN